jgi:hypothetical protein
MCLGNKREKVGRWFQEENGVVDLDHDREYIDVQGRERSGDGRNEKK